MSRPGRLLRRSIGVAVALASAGALALLSEARYTAEPADHAVLRLAWRARGERVRRCRRATPEELAELPAHMRQEEVCERGVVPYRLLVAVDGTSVVDELVRAGGARGDRPLFVFRELRLSAGQHHLAITFEREGTTREQEQIEEERRAPDARATPPRLALDESVVVVPRAIVLVTYDDEQQRLRLLAAPPSGR